MRPARYQQGPDWVWRRSRWNSLVAWPPWRSWTPVQAPRRELATGMISGQKGILQTLDKRRNLHSFAAFTSRSVFFADLLELLVFSDLLGILLFSELLTFSSVFMEMLSLFPDLVALLLSSDFEDLGFSAFVLLLLS